MAYVIGEQSSAQYAFSQFDRGFMWMWQNGTDVTNVLGRIDQFAMGGTIYVKTTSEDLVGKQRTFLRGCTRLN